MITGFDELRSIITDMLRINENSGICLKFIQLDYLFYARKTRKVQALAKNVLT